ncbi:MAG TPA: nucleotidyltransferase domain-containing protein [bacterium]
MSPKNKEIVLAIHNLLKKKFSDYAGLYFYGSRTGKKFKSESDFDIVVTFKNEVDWKRENEVWGEIALFELENNIFTDIKIYQYSELHRQDTPYRENVIKTGMYYGL